MSAEVFVEHTTKSKQDSQTKRGHVLYVAPRIPNTLAVRLTLNHGRISHSGDFMARHRYKLKFVLQSVITAYDVGWSILLASQVN